MIVNLILTAFTHLASVSLVRRQFYIKLPSGKQRPDTKIGNNFFIFSPLR